MYGCNMYVAAHVTPVTIIMYVAAHVTTVTIMYVAALHVRPVSIIMPGPLPCMGKAHGTRVACMWEHM